MTPLGPIFTTNVTPDRETGIGTGRRAVHSREHELQIDAKFEFGDDHERGCVVSNGYNIATANLALHLEAKLFEEAFDRKI